MQPSTLVEILSFFISQPCTGAKTNVWNRFKTVNAVTHCSSFHASMSESMSKESKAQNDAKMMQNVFSILKRCVILGLCGLVPLDKFASKMSLHLGELTSHHGHHGTWSGASTVMRLSCERSKSCPHCRRPEEAT